MDDIHSSSLIQLIKTESSVKNSIDYIPPGTMVGCNVASNRPAIREAALPRTYREAEGDHRRVCTEARGFSYSDSPVGECKPEGTGFVGHTRLCACCIEQVQAYS